GAPVSHSPPAGTNVTADGGGGGALEAKMPANQVGDFETFTIERVSNPPSAPGAEIKNGDTVALKAANGRHYVSASTAAGSLTAGATQRGASETFTIQIAAAPPVQAEPPSGLRAEGGYVEHI